jgi:hypothetical protein
MNGINMKITIQALLLKQLSIFLVLSLLLLGKWVQAASETPAAIVSQYATQGSMNAVTLKGTKAYIAAGSEGLLILDVNDRHNLLQLGQFPSNNYLYEVALSKDGTRAYLAEGKQLVILDISDPANILELGRLNAGSTGYIEAVALSPDDKRLYLANGWAGFYILDLSDPAEIKQLGAFSTDSYVGDITVAADGKKVYLSDVWKGFIVMNVVDPLQPTAIAQFAPQSADTGHGFTRDSVLSPEGSIAYVLDSTDGLLILDILDPSQPNLLGQLPLTLGVSAGITLSADGATVYIANANYGGAGLISIDVSDPAQVRQVNQLDLAQAVNVTLSSDERSHYIAARAKGLFVLDSSKLTQ